MKKIIIMVQLCFIINVLNAQITTDEPPYSWSITEDLATEQKDVIVLPVPDKALIEKEDQINDQQPGPLRFAYPVHVNFTPENSGSWQNLNDGGKLWRLTVNLPEALSANVMYDKFWLPDGAQFYVYNNETKQFIGAITNEFLRGNSKNPATFATAIIYGENISFEYYQSATVMEPAVISISRIDYGYRFINNPYLKSPTELGESGSCEININCPEGNNWQEEKHAVARVGVVSPGGSGWCSCELINNTNEDQTPYVLTAHHCLEGLDAISNNDAGQWTFYWEYEYPGCPNSGTPPNRTTTGAIVKANNSTSDFALLLLSQDPKNITGVTPYYLGWDRSGSAGTGGVGIHHPAGDVKKISLYTMTPQSTAYSSNTVDVNANHWRVIWSSGTTEGGSSGSSLINSSHHVIGQLHGGSASCSALTQPDWYGKFSVSWNNSSDSRRRLKDWLDPYNTGATVLDGTSCVVNFTNQTVTSNTTVTSCGDINVQNVTVTNGAKLTLDAPNETIINGSFEVVLGSQLEIK